MKFTLRSYLARVRVRRVSILIIFLVSGALMACEESIEGRISVVGSEPLTYLALTTEEGDQVELVGESASELSRKHQGRRVRIYGTILREEQGPGRPARVRVDRFELID